MISFSRVIRNLSIWYNASHVLPQSCWALAGSAGLGAVALGAALSFHCHRTGHVLFSLGLFLFIWVVYSWWTDVDNESYFHTESVQLSMRLGMMVFIISEVMFFVGFFWAFFHSSLNADHSIGCVWPPKHMPAVAASVLPLFNTLLLLLSGFYATEAFIVTKIHPFNRDKFAELTDYAIALGSLFIFCQYIEYRMAAFNISSGIYGSIFFLATGFHGLHVIIGVIALTITTDPIIYMSSYFDNEQIRSKRDVDFISYEFATWYWHFVDVVWICLFICVYWWGGY